MEVFRMEIGIGLPSMIPGTSGDRIAEWAQRAEAGGFSSLGTLDRLLYESYEPLTALSAAAAVTERIGLTTAVLLGPLHANRLVLAKQALSVQALSGGRFTLGVGLGSREDDFEASGIETRNRGRALDELLTEVTAAWDGGRLGPSHSGRPRLMVGGHAEQSFARAARFGDGWIAGASGPEQFAEFAPRARQAWADVGREGEPYTMAIAYYSLGERAEENARADLGHYYAWLGEEIAQMLIDAAATDADAVKGYVAAYEEAGCDEVIFFPCAADLEQVDLLAEAVGL
jgi:alkanesulfonate monooxygenase SsuD/methylene tetrahydromethanopterin reductase-like flavin-dependent oxidoreductase (luciferase family)